MEEAHWVFFDLVIITSETIILLLWAQAFLKEIRCNAILIGCGAVVFIAFLQRFSDLFFIPNPWGFIIHFVLDLVVLSFMFKDLLSNRFICLLMFYTIDLLLDSLVIIIISLVFDVPFSTMLVEPYYHILASVISKVALLAVIGFGIQYLKKRHWAGGRQNKLLTILPILIPAATILMAVCLPFHINREVQQAMSVVSICFLLVGYLALNVLGLCSICLAEKLSRAKIETEAANWLVKQTAEANIIQESLEKIKGLVHDQHHHLQYLKELTKDSNRVEEATNYIVKNTEELEEVNPTITGNLFVDTILSYHRRIMKENGIDFKVIGELPQIIEVEPHHLASLLGNALDNAREACEGGINPWVEVLFSYSKFNVLIDVSNPIEKEAVSFLTKKKPEQIHGIGLKNMETIVERYHGFLVPEVSQRRFTIHILLQFYNPELSIIKHKGSAEAEP